MKKNTLLILFIYSAFLSFSQLDYRKMKDTICPSLCGIRDSSLVRDIYIKLQGIDTTKITSGLAQYYEDLSHVQYDLCLWNDEDSTYMRMSLQNTEKSLFHDPNNIGMLWNASFGYTVFKDCDKTHYYLNRYFIACPKKYWKEKAQKEQIGILLMMCPNEELKRKFKIKDETETSVNLNQTDVSSIKTNQSQYFIDTLFSQSLSENRLVTVYLPKGFNKDLKYPVVYMADGQLLIESYVKSLDSLIENKAIPEIVVIGIQSNETLIPSMGLEYRNFEYINNLHGGKDTLNKRFDKHFQFFTSEVVEYAEKNYSVSDKKEDRTFYGISNGADFGVTLAQEKPDFIGNYILCSIVAGSKEPFTWTKNNSPHFFISCGDKEDQIVQDEAKELGNYLSEKSIHYEISLFNGGHERKKWEAQFIKTIPKVFVAQ